MSAAPYVLGVMVPPPYAARLEALLERQQEIDPTADEEAVFDQIFLRGLEAFEQPPSQAVAGANAELLFRQILDQGETIVRLLDRLAAMKTELAAALADVRAAREAA